MHIIILINNGYYYSYLYVKYLQMRYTLYDIQCTAYNVRHTMYDIQCTTYNVLHTMYDVQCTTYDVRRICVIFYLKLITALYHNGYY